MIVAMLKQSPQRSETTRITPFVSPLFINGRRYLKVNEPKAKEYLPICLATGVIEFPHIQDYTYDGSADDANVVEENARGALLRACRAAHHSYQKIRERKSILSESLQRAEFLPK